MLESGLGIPLANTSVSTKTLSFMVLQVEDGVHGRMETFVW
jgi:hypothetical protein